MRTVKASEVRKGMRVRVEHDRGGATQTLEGVVDDSRSSNFGDGWYIRVGNLLHANVSPDHPVTVLAEPEPEWVEGAWYRFSAGGDRQYLGRVENGGMVEPDGTDYGSEYITVLGRVLIVDWPGDDVARAIERTYTPGNNWIATENTAAQIIADAIRTQGGAP